MFRLKSVDEMDPDMVLEVPDTPDRLMRVKVTSSPCQRNVEVPDTPDRLMRVKAAASSSSQRNAEYSEHIYSRHHNSVGNSVNKSRISPHDTEELFKRAKLALSISDAPQPSTTPKTKQNGVVTEGKESRKNVDNHNNPLHTSYLTRCGDARRNSGKEPLNEDSELLGHHRKSELFVVGSSSPTSSVGKPQSQFSIEMSQTGKAILQDEKHVNIKSTDKGKGTQPCNDSQLKSEHTMSNTLPTDITWRSTGRRRLVRNGVISPCNTENNNFQSKLHHGHAAAPSVTRPCSSLVGINSHDNSEEAPLSETGDRNKESRGVLHNANPDYRTIRKLKQDKVESVVLPGAVNGLNSISHVIGSAGNNCNGKYDYSKKGKAIVDSNVVNEQDGKIALHPHRTHRRAETEMTVTGGASCHASIAEDPDFCAVNLSEKPSIFSSSGAFNIHKTKEMPNKKLESRSGFANVLDNSKTTMFPESNSNREQTISELISETRRKVTIKGKRKYSSTVDSTGQQSKSDFENSEILCLGTSQQALNSRSSRSRTRQRSNIVLGPIIEVDELHSPEAASSNPPLGSPEVSLSANARIRQVESDEILARRLQEQLYNESPEIGTNDEIDAAIALSLQEESIRHTSSASRQSRRNGIDAAIALSLQEGSVRRTSSASRNRRNGRERFIAHLRSQLASRNARYRSSTGIARLMRDIDLQGMDMDMRLDLFEELEVAFDNSNTSALSHILQVQRDFNENDYETLLALDDNNHQHLGASETQINNLPQSVMQTNNVEEPCAICLENPSVGDIIRHLPCLHKFHKDCIDQWLRRKISCPVCKTDIT